MSINVHFVAKRDIIVKSTGEEDVQITYYNNVWMTPSEVSRKIQESDKGFKQAYIDWVLSTSEWVLEDIYDYSSYMEKVVGQRMVNVGEEHVKEFSAWCDLMESKGYVIELEVY